MSDTVWIDAYCELALSLVPLTVFNCKPRLKLRPGPGVRLYEHIREAMLYDNSPWDIYLIHGEGLSEPPGLMPTLLDISTGIPNFTCFEPRRIPTIQPVFVAEVYCSLCLSSQAVSFDIAQESFHQTAHAMTCDHCHSLIWPWRMSLNVPVQSNQ